MTTQMPMSNGGDKFVANVDDDDAVEVPRAAAAGRKLLLLTCGSRGDIQPYIALASALQQAGFIVYVGTNSNHVSFVQRFRLKVFKSAGDSEDWVRNDPELRKCLETGDINKYMDALKTIGKVGFPDELAKLTKEARDFEPDAILSTPLVSTECLALGAALDVPVIPTALQVVLPSVHGQSMFGEPEWFPGRWHLALMTLVLHLWWRGELEIKLEEIKKQLPAACSYLPLNARAMMLMVNHPVVQPVTGCSLEVFPQFPDYPQDCRPHKTGFWVVSKKEQHQRMCRKDSKFGGNRTDDLGLFIKNGVGAPVYMGWGSMIAGTSEHMSCLAVRSLMKANLRGIILAGWAELGPDKLKGQSDTAQMEAYASKNVLWMSTAPHEWLFPHCSVIVHHGGAGTTAAALRSGVPTIITPCAFDQFHHASLLTTNGNGIGMPHFSKIRPEALAAALTKCVSDEAVKAKAAALGEKLQKENGPAEAVKVISNFFTDEFDTGKWKAKMSDFRNQIVVANKQPRSCFAWIGTLCCSSDYNNYHVKC
jgi:sterol 3beta-glucosyltransferase